MSNLRLINETTVTSGVSSFNMTDIFSADYDIYKVTISDVVSTNGYWYLRPINSSGSVIATSDMDNARLLQKANASFGKDPGTNTSSLWHVQSIAYSSGTNGVFYIYNPFDSSSYTFMTGVQVGYFSANGSRNQTNIGVYRNSDSITGLNISQQSSGTFTAGKLRTYGLRVDS